MAEMCEAQLYAASLTAPAEFCEEEAVEGEEFCDTHLRLNDIWTQADEAYARMKEGW